MHFLLGVIQFSTCIFCDNMGASLTAEQGSYNIRSKHLAIRSLLVKDLVSTKRQLSGIYFSIEELYFDGPMKIFTVLLLFPSFCIAVVLNYIFSIKASVVGACWNNWRLSLSLYPISIVACIE